MLTPTDRSNLLELRRLFEADGASHARIGVRASAATRLDSEQRTVLRSFGYDLSFPQSPDYRTSPGLGLSIARQLLESGIPFAYERIVPGQRYPRTTEVAPGLPLDATRPMSALEAMAGSISPQQAAIVGLPIERLPPEDFQRTVDAINEETWSQRAMDTRDEHPRVISAGGEVYRIGDPVHPDLRTGFMFRGGFGGAGFDVTYPDGHVVHTNNLMHQGPANDARFLTNAELRGSPIRESLQYVQRELTAEQRAFARDGMILMRPEPTGSGRMPQPVSWTSDPARAMLRREAETALERRGLSSDALDATPPAQSFGKVVAMNEGWLLLADQDDRVTAHRLDRDEDFALANATLSRDERRPRAGVWANVERNEGGTLASVTIAREQKRPRLQADLVRDAARATLQADRVSGLADGSEQAADIVHAQAIIAGEPDPYTLAQRIEALNDLPQERVLPHDFLVELQSHAERMRDAALAALDRYQDIESRLNISNYDDDRVIALDPRTLARAIHAIEPLGESRESIAPRYVLGVAELHQKTGLTVINDLLTGKLVDVTSSEITPGESALVRSDARTETRQIGPEDFVDVVVDADRSSVYPIRSQSLDDAHDTIAGFYFSDASLDRLLPFADLSRAERLLESAGANALERITTSTDDRETNRYGTTTIILRGDPSPTHTATSREDESTYEVFGSRASATASDLWRYGSGRLNEITERLPPSRETASTIADSSFDLGR